MFCMMCMELVAQLNLVEGWPRNLVVVGLNHIQCVGPTIFSSIF